MSGRAVGETRKNRFTVETSQGEDIIANTFVNLTVANPISIADLRTALAAPSLNDNATMRNRIQVTDQGGAIGKCLSITLPNSSAGVVFQPELPSFFDEGYIEFDIRFRTGFGWGVGGKIMGLGGTDGTISAPPSGGNGSPHGWAGRSMWRTDGIGEGDLPGRVEWTEYKYWPGMASGSFGVVLHCLEDIGAEGGVSDGAWRHIKKYYKMNTTTVTNTSIDPTTLVQGTDYLNDGDWKVYIDGDLMPAAGFPSQVLRYYQPTSRAGGITNWSFAFFYGGSDAWAGGGGIIDIANPHIVKVA